MRGRWRSWRAPGSVSNVFVFFHYLLWKAKLNFDCLELKARLVVYQRSIRSGFHCLLWRYENPSLHYTPPAADGALAWAVIAKPTIQNYEITKTMNAEAQTRVSSGTHITYIGFTLTELLHLSIAATWCVEQRRCTGRRPPRCSNWF